MEGSEFGDYELVRYLARGGMGVVYEARQISANRMVALKMIRAGIHATLDEVRRFRTEAEAAAALDHPNIVQIYEVGEEDHQPFFSMKLVRGGSLAEGIARGDWRLDSTNAEELQRRIATLIGQVARAIHHAHQRSILHRDLKPANILIELDGQALVSDFGLAKFVDREHGATLSGQLVGTPAYMAPEQASSSPRELTTAVDVYSLGAILYELLTGQVPFVAERPELVVHMLATTEPRRPSALVRQVRRDLEVICLKCLEKDPKRRYGSAEAVAEELERWLRYEPILARQSGVWFRVGKWARRKPAIAALSAALVMISISGFGIVLSQLEKTERARREATESLRKQETEAKKSREVVNFLARMLEGIGPNVALGRDTTLLREVLNQTSAHLGQDLASQPEVEAELRYTLGNVYQALGEVDTAEHMLRRALELAVSVHGSNHVTTAQALRGLAMTWHEQGLVDQSAALLNRSLRILTDLNALDSREGAVTLSYLGTVQTEKGLLSDAEESHRKAIESLKRSLGARHPEVASFLDSLAVTLKQQGRLSDAVNVQREAADITASLDRDDPRVLVIKSALAGMLRRQKQLPEAENLAREVLEAKKRILGTNHVGLATAMNNLALVLSARENYVAAEGLYRETLALLSRNFGDQHPKVAAAFDNLGLALAHQGKLADAEAAHRQSLSVYEQVYKTNAHPDLATTLNHLSNVLDSANRLGDAETAQRRAIAIEEECYTNSHPNLATSLHNLALLRERRGHLDEAEVLHRRALAMRRQLLDGPFPDIAISLDSLARLLERRGNLEESERMHREALQRRRTLHGDIHPDVATSLNNLAMELFRQDKLVEAEALHREALAIRKKLYPNGSVVTAVSMDNLGLALQRPETIAEAEALHRDALAMFTALRGPTSSSVLTCLDSLARALEFQGKWEDAIQTRRQALEGTRQRDKGGGPQSALALAAFARAILRAGHYGEAEKQARAYLALTKGSLTNGWVDNYVQAMLGRSLFSQGKQELAGPYLTNAYRFLTQTGERLSTSRRGQKLDVIQWSAEYWSAVGATSELATVNQQLRRMRAPEFKVTPIVSGSSK